MIDSKQSRMFPELGAIPDPPLDRRKHNSAMDQMYKDYGRHGAFNIPGGDDRSCGECTYLQVKIHHTKTYFKCAIYGDTNGAATDWRKKWIACGHFLTPGIPENE